MSTPKVSIIVCAYNQEQTIARTLDSILCQQTDFPYEIILADDCSGDSTPDICADYASRYPDIIRLSLNRHNKGITDNYFDCVESCRGEYIADLAGDDIWVDPDKLAKQVKILDSDTGIVLCHAGWRPVYPDGSFAPHDSWHIPSAPHTKQAGEVTLSLLRHDKERYFIHLCSAMYRRDTILGLIKKYPPLFRDKSLPCEDLQINVMMSNAGKIAYIPDIVMHYTVGAPSISSNENPLKIIRFMSGSMRLTMLLADTLGIDRNELAGYTGDALQYMIMQYFTTFNTDGRKLVDSFLKQNHLPLTPKNRLTRWLSRSRFTWKSALHLRGILKTLHLA